MLMLLLPLLEKEGGRRGIENFISTSFFCRNMPVLSYPVLPLSDLVLDIISHIPSHTTIATNLGITSNLIISLDLPAITNA